MLADAISQNNLDALLSQILEATAYQEVTRGVIKATSEGTARLDISNLVQTVRELFSAGIAKSSQKNL